MGILLIVLKCVGFTNDALALAQGIDWLVTQDKHCSSEELFKTCFGHALKQQLTKLATLSESREASSISLDHHALQAAVIRVGQMDATKLSNSSHAIAREIAHNFRDCIIIPGHRCSDDAIDAEIGRVRS